MIAILDFGSQFCHLILKKLRYLKIPAKIFPFDVKAEVLQQHNVKGIIFSGGPRSIYEPNAPHPDPKIYALNLPILGICYGSNLVAAHFGGDVKRTGKAEYGIETLYVTNLNHPLMKGLQKEEQVLMSHGDNIEQLPPTAQLLGKTKKVIAAFAIDDKKAYGVQFHPEVHHTPHGALLLENFTKICNVEKTDLHEDFIEKQVTEIKNTVKEDEHVLVAVSGGVDSTVTALIIAKAVPNRLHAIFINNGLLRKNEAEEVNEMYKHLFPQSNYYYVDASEKFLSRLRDVTDPQKKRLIIGQTFNEVYGELVKELRSKGINLKYLGQGTIYPDRIESAAPSKQASKIKQHHNLVPLPKYLNLQLIEPLKDLFKFEVREIGKRLGLSEKFIKRHPFPGPGLAVRCLGQLTKERLDTLREADAILHELVLKYDLYDTVWQSFAVLLPVKTVGVQGDERTYREVIAIRIVESVDAMTATVPELPWEFLKECAQRIVDEVPGVNRVVLDITSKPPATIEWE